ncbi:uncharacterized protein TNCV_953871 [Trichonephila clavipes]|nr:uncharacterized protein TNCV_953871 [Trichonephila clavipes]
MGKLPALDTFDHGQIKRVAWSAESGFRLLNTDERLRIWRQAHEAIDPACQVGTVQGHGGSMMVWDDFLRNFFGIFCACTNLIQCNTKSRLATGWFDEHSSDFSVIYWSPRSPDLNPIQLLLDALEQGVKGHLKTPTNLTELRTALANIWQVISLENFHKLVESLPRRVVAVINVREGPTRF